MIIIQITFFLPNLLFKLIKKNQLLFNKYKLCYNLYSSKIVKIESFVGDKMNGVWTSLDEENDYIRRSNVPNYNINIIVKK